MHDQSSTTPGQGNSLDDIVTCPMCGSIQTRSITRHILRNGSVRRRHKCRACGRDYFTTRATADRLPAKRLSYVMAATDTHRPCTICRKTLPIEKFGRRIGKGGVRLPTSACRECLNAARRHHYYTREILRDYGISAERYRELTDAQKGLCAICHRPESRRRGQCSLLLAIDHCHETGKIRGLLCHKCNLGIGNFNDDASRLEAAAAYLRRHKDGATGDARIRKEVSNGSQRR